MSQSDSKKTIKLIVLAVVALAAIVVLAMNFMGGGTPGEQESPEVKPQPSPPPESTPQPGQKQDWKGGPMLAPPSGS